MSNPASDALRESFLHFVQVCTGQSPLYAALSARLADEPEFLALAAGGAPGQPPPNLLFGAAHFLLLGGVRHPLAAFYPSVGGQSGLANGSVNNPADAWPDFADFCRRYEREIVQQVTMRRVQTNEVGRCGLLLPAFAAAHERCARPLALIEVGASAGLALLFDQYRYEYSDGRSVGRLASPVVIRTELQGPRAPARLETPPVAGRVGVDIAPVDVTDRDAMDWLEALIWPEHVDRLEMFRQAVALARTCPPRVLAGNGLEQVPVQVERISAEHVPCIYHSHALYQISAAERVAFDEMVRQLGARRDLAHISLEWLDDDPGPRLHITFWSSGQADRRHLADCHPHGRWMRWVG